MRFYDIDAFNVTLARPEPRIILCSHQAAGPFGTAVGLASVEAVMRRVATNMDHHAMRVGRVGAPSRVDVSPAVGRLEVGHAVVCLSARDGHAPMAISRPIGLAAFTIWNTRQAWGRALWFYPTIGAAIRGRIAVALVLCWLAIRLAQLICARLIGALVPRSQASFRPCRANGALPTPVRAAGTADGRATVVYWSMSGLAHSADSSRTSRHVREVPTWPQRYRSARVGGMPEDPRTRLEVRV